ncbi:MAG: hypothetical protein WBF05_03600 [Anaerolineales bacterium]
MPALKYPFFGYQPCFSYLPSFPLLEDGGGTVWIKERDCRLSADN